MECCTEFDLVFVAHYSAILYFGVSFQPVLIYKSGHIRNNINTAKYERT